MTVSADWTARRARRSRARHLRPTNPAAGVARRRVALCGSVWLCVALRGAVWGCVALCGAVWLVWRCVAPCGAVCVASAATLCVARVCRKRLVSILLLPRLK